MFEVVAVLALKFFAEEQCDLVIWETGLGGRLDATNIVTPVVSIITNIAFDHTEWLGDTLPKIAAEKAGIIKPGVPVITAETNPEALKEIQENAREKNARLKIIPEGLAGTLGLSLLGEHQKRNAAVAVAVVEELQDLIPVGAEPIRNGLAKVSWPGRLQLIQRDGQKILLDGAHNVAGAETLRDALKMDFAGIRPVFIFGALADKNWPEISRILAPLAAKVFTVPVASERTLAAARLAAAFCAAKANLPAVAVSQFAEALTACKDEPFVVVTGSLYLVGEALEQLGFCPAEGGERGLNDWKAMKTCDKTLAS